MSVYEKILKLQAATRSLQANAEGQTGTARYKYINGTKLLGVVRPKMDELGLLLIPDVTDIQNQLITYNTTRGSKTEMFTSLKLRFTWIDAEDGSSISQEFAANGMNAFDKGVGSALTYAERYFLLKTLHIATDEDDVDGLVKEEPISMHPCEPQQEMRGGLNSRAYWQTVQGYVDGRQARTGQDLRSAWIESIHPTNEEVEQFDRDCDNVRAARGLC